MPKQVKARAAQDEQEARTVRKLAKSYHAPADWKFHAQMVVGSWVGKTMVARDEEGSAKFRLDALAQAAKEASIQVKRSQIRCIFLREGVRWRQTHSWGTSQDPDLVPKGRRSSATTPNHPRGRRPSVPTNSGQ